MILLFLCAIVTYFTRIQVFEENMLSFWTIYDNFTLYMMIYDNFE